MLTNAISHTGPTHQESDFIFLVHVLNKKLMENANMQNVPFGLKIKMKMCLNVNVTTKYPFSCIVK